MMPMLMRVVRGLIAGLLLVGLLGPAPAAWAGETQEAVLAGGCFWCLEHDLESLPGVGKVKSRRTMERIGIAESRRLRGLGDKQRRELLAVFG